MSQSCSPSYVLRMLRHWSALVYSSWLSVWQWEITNTTEAGTLLSIACDGSVFEGRLCVVSATLNSKLILRCIKDKKLIYLKLLYPETGQIPGLRLSYSFKDREYKSNMVLVRAIAHFRGEGNRWDFDICGMTMSRGKLMKLGEKSAAVPLCPLRISHDVTRNWTHGSTNWCQHL
jgi:hypothetical protein